MLNKLSEWYCCSPDITKPGRHPGLFLFPFFLPSISHSLFSSMPSARTDMIPLIKAVIISHLDYNFLDPVLPDASNPNFPLLLKSPYPKSKIKELAPAHIPPRHPISAMITSRFYCMKLMATFNQIDSFLIECPLIFQDSAYQSHSLLNPFPINPKSGGLNSSPLCVLLHCTGFLSWHL